MASIKDFLNTHCYFRPQEFGGKFEKDFLFETEKFVYLVYRKWAYKNNLIIMGREEFQKKVLFEANSIGAVVTFDLFAKVLNYNGPIFFGFRFLPNIYDVYSFSVAGGRSVSGFSTEDLGVFRGFIKNHLTYFKGGIESVDAVYCFYKDYMKLYDAPFLWVNDFINQLKEEVPQCEIRGGGAAREFLNIKYTLEGIDRKKIQKILDAQRKELYSNKAARPAF